MRNALSIILVDDDRSNTRLLQILLEMDGYEVIACPTIAKAGAAVDGATKALIIDCNLAHGVNGLSLLTDVRGGNTAASIDIPIIVTSGDDRWQQIAVEAGADRFLLKPYSPSVLTKELARLIEQEKPIGKI